jgi:hypothetical protein
VSNPLSPERARGGELFSGWEERSGSEKPGSLQVRLPPVGPSRDQGHPRSSRRLGDADVVPAFRAAILLSILMRPRPLEFDEEHATARAAGLVDLAIGGERGAGFSCHHRRFFPFNFLFPIAFGRQQRGHLKATRRAIGGRPTGNRIGVHLIITANPLLYRHRRVADIHPPLRAVSLR